MLSIPQSLNKRCFNLGLELLKIAEFSPSFIFNTETLFPDAPTAIHVISAFYGFNRYKANFRKFFRK